MRLQSLTLENFRNYSSLKLQFQKPLTIIYGKNAQGKSNLIESIYLLSIAKSFRTNNNRDLIRNNNVYTRIKADVAANDFEKELEYFYQFSPKAANLYKSNGQKLKIVEFYSIFKAVLFSPENLDNFFREPEEKRKYMNLLLSHINKDNLISLYQYKKVLKQKNALLKAIFFKQENPSQLDYWNQKLASYGSRIILNRLELIHRINSEISGYYQQISKSDEKLNIEYITTEIKLNKINNQETLEENLLNLYLKYQEKEIYFKKTLIGPHLDDLTIKINNQPIKTYASRGEQRTFFLSLKKVETLLIEKLTKIKPVLLLDDIYSELDDSRRNFLIQMLDSHQTILTTLTLNHLPKEKNMEIFEVKNGEMGRIK